MNGIGNMSNGMKVLAIIMAMAAATVSATVAQTPYIESDSSTVSRPLSDRKLIELIEDEESTFTEEDLDENGELIMAFDDMWADTLDTAPAPEPLRFLPVAPLPAVLFMPMVYDEFRHLDSIATFDPEPLVEAPYADLDWIKIEANRARRYRELKQRYMLDNIRDVRYNIYTMPKPPKKYTATVDPSTESITVKEIITDKKVLVADAATTDVARKNWLHNIDGRLQFSQAYISPNWYQGGNNNVNGIGSFKWNVKLNQKFHPKFIVEATTEYKVGLASAPQDSIHAYNITQDQFQFNGTLGLKAIDKWYYSVNTQFKTQLLNNYKPNTRDLKAAFMTPGELNLGVGMTYNYKNPKRKFTLDASISPFSYNLKIATNPGIPKKNFGIDPGHHTTSEFGSNAEVKVNWTLAWNVTYSSRLFLFTDYDYTQGDWENTFNFSINRYFSTQLYIHVRYDSHQLPLEDTSWHHWQLKEILSFGFQYQFKTI